MPFKSRQICVPLFHRKLVLRALLISAPVYFSTALFIDSDTLYTAVRYYYGNLTLSLFTIAHHILRLWRRKRWLMIYEVLVSLAEAITVCVIIPPQVVELFSTLRASLGSLNNPFQVLLQTIFMLVMSLSIFLSLIFLLCDVTTDRGKHILHPYDFSAGLSNSGYQWSFVGGRFVARKRFSTDNPFIRFSRGVIAILILVAISLLVVYAVIWQPIQESTRPGLKVLTVPMLGDQDTGAGAALNPQMFSRIMAVLPVQNASAATHYYPNMTMVLESYSPFNIPQSKLDCQSEVGTVGVVLAQCFTPKIPGRNDRNFLEVTIIIRFPKVLDNFRVYLGMTDSVNDILTHAKPIGINPGMNLHGWSSFAAKERLSNQDAAAFGIPQYNRFVVIDVHSITPDISPFVPKDNHTATLRVTMQSQQFVEIEQEYFENSVLHGFALVGGVWTLVNGVFALIFGSTLLLVLFGIKPLSIYGIVHRFRPGKGSLVDANYVLTPEERDRTVGILREHLLDADDTPASAEYYSVGILPQFNSHCDAGTQM